MRLFDSLPEDKRSLITRHLDLVIKANETTNLTRISTLEDGLLLHVEDSLVGLEELDSAPSGLYGDLGSGAGYPGIPLAIATARPTVLIDARQKKARILDEFIEELGLSDQVKTYAGRAELLARSQPNQFAALTARALSKLSVLMELASPLLKRGGLLICYKAGLEEAEMVHAESVQEITGMNLVSQRKVDLEGHERTIVVFGKTSKPSIKLPRLEGQAQKNPL